MVKWGGREEVAITKDPSLVPVLVRVKALVTIWHSATRGPKSTVEGERARRGDGGMLHGVCMCVAVAVCVHTYMHECKQF